MSRFSGAVITLDHHPAIVLEAREDGPGETPWVEARNADDIAKLKSQAWKIREARRIGGVQTVDEDPGDAELQSSRDELEKLFFCPAPRRCATWFSKPWAARPVAKSSPLKWLAQQQFTGIARLCRC